MLLETVVGLALFGGALSLSGILTRDKVNYDVAGDYRYELEPDWSGLCRFEDGQLRLEDIPSADHTLILALRVEHARQIVDPFIRISAGDEQVTYYFERGARGLRYVDLTRLATALAQSTPVEVTMRGCRCEPQQLLGFARPRFDELRFLVIAPHPDDAEIAAYALYERHASRTTIVTVSPGERIGNLKRQYLPGLDENAAAATRRKGDIRSWDAHCVPRWAGVHPDNIISLGYFNATLQRMQRAPDEVVPHGVIDDTPAVFRRFNTVPLPSDGTVQNRWHDLVGDLAAVIEARKPDIIVLPHPELDVHPDHAASTSAVFEALERVPSHGVSHLMFYCNHSEGTGQFPFGPAWAGTGLFPNSKPLSSGRKVYSETLDAEAQRRKACALSFMHDLAMPFRPFKHVKRELRNRLRWRSRHYYGPDTYFRTALRDSELFLLVSLQQTPLQGRG